MRCHRTAVGQRQICQACSPSAIEKKIICAADVGAKSSSEMKVIGNRKDENDAMLNDLRHAAVRTGIELLVAAGPKKTIDAGLTDAGTKKDAGKAP